MIRLASERHYSMFVIPLLRSRFAHNLDLFERLMLQCWSRQRTVAMSSPLGLKKPKESQTLPLTSSKNHGKTLLHIYVHV